MSVISSIAESIENPYQCNWELEFGGPGQGAQYLNLHDAREMINAHAYLSQTMRPTMVHLTIRWARMEGFAGRDWLKIQGELLERMSRWLMRNGLPVAYLWAREMGRRAGPHTHLLLHLPSKHWARFMKFVMESGGFSAEPDPIGTALKLSAGVFGLRKRSMQFGVMRYLLKGLDPNAVVRQPAADGGTVSLPAALGVKHDPDRLPVYGKKVGTSYLIGPTMRRNYGWRSIHTAAELRAALQP